MGWYYGQHFFGFCGTTEAAAVGCDWRAACVQGFSENLKRWDGLNPVTNGCCCNYSQWSLRFYGKRIPSTYAMSL